MSNLSPTEKLNNLIAVMEIKQRIEYNELKEQFDTTLEEIKPENILANTLASFTSGANRSGIVSTLVSLATDFITDKLIHGKSNNILQKFAGLGIQYITNTFFSKKQASD